LPHRDGFGAADFLAVGGGTAAVGDDLDPVTKVCGDGLSKTAITYDRPSKMFGQWREPVFPQTGQLLDQKLEARWLPRVTASLKRSRKTAVNGFPLTNHQIQSDVEASGRHTHGP